MCLVLHVLVLAQWSGPKLSVLAKDVHLGRNGC